MIELVRHLALVCAIGLGLAVPAWADEPLHGQVIGVVGGDIITLVDARQREHQLRLAFIDPPEPGQPFADEAQSALSAMVLGRQVTAQVRGRDRDGIAAVEVVEPHGHVVNLELVRRGLAWRDYFDAQNQPDREQYQTALSEAQQARQPAAERQLELGLQDDEPARNREQLMKALDGINGRWGKGTMRVGQAKASDAAAGGWQMRQERRTPAYTTEWASMPSVRC